jgi:hypothetical protein
VCLFSTRTAADRYQQQFVAGGEVWEPQPIELARTLSACWSAGVRWAAIDPSGEAARQLLDLAAVLRNIRDSLRAGRGLPS